MPREMRKQLGEQYIPHEYMVLMLQVGSCLLSITSILMQIIVTTSKSNSPGSKGYQNYAVSMAAQLPILMTQVWL